MLVKQFLAKQTLFLPGPLYFYKLRRPAAKPTEYDKERIAYKKLLKEYNKRNIKDYWNYQTQIENEFIDNYLAKQKKNAEELPTKVRSYLLKMIDTDTKRMLFLKEKSIKKEDNLKKYLHEQDIKKMNRQQILSILREESKTWFNEQNLETNLVTNVVFPEQIVDETEYYLNLQEQALYYESGQYDELNSLIDEHQQITNKNKIGIQYFKKIVSVIKYLCQKTKLAELENEWSVSRSVLLNDKNLENSQLSAQLSKLDDAFLTVIQEHINTFEQNIPLRIEFLNRQLIQIYNLLQLWEKYISVLKINPSFINELVKAQETNTDLFSGEKQQSKDQSELSSKEATTGEKKKDEYLSAEEKHTTDEEEIIDIEKMIQEKQKQQIQTDKDVAEMKKKMKEEEKSEKQAVQDDSMANEDDLKMINTIMRVTDQNEKKIEEEFEKQYAERSGKSVLYGYAPKKNLPETTTLLKGVNLDDLFPKQVLEKQLNFDSPNLDFKTFSEIMKFELEKKQFYESAKQNKNEVMIQDPESKKLQTMVVVEVYKDELNKLKNVQNLSQHHQQLIQQNQQLLDLIAEHSIDEPQFLYQLWNYHKN